MNFRSVSDLNHCVVTNLHRLPRDIDLVVGIPRSGMLAANLMALHLNLPLIDLEGFLAGRMWGGGERQRLYSSAKSQGRRRVLIVDDTVNRGTEMTRARERVKAAGLDVEVVFACIYVAPQSKDKVDVFFEICETPRIFEWNLMHHSFLADSCLDIDGVLCRDPLPEENDDGPRYQEFLSHAEPFLLPTVEVGYLVTCRLEKYRPLTVEWLARHGVKYRELVMMDLPTREARIASGSHGKFKAEVYLRTETFLFVESDSSQAREIAERSRKPVLCLGTREMINR